MPRSIVQVTAAALACGACTPPSESPADIAPTPEVTGAAVTIEGRLDVRPTLGAVEGDLQITLAAADAASVEFFLNRDLDVSTVTGADVVGYRFSRDGSGFGDWGTLEVELAPDRAPGAVTIAIAYEGVPTMPADGINAIREDWVEISLDGAAIPVPADLAHEIGGELTIGLPVDWTLVAPTPPLWTGDAWTLTIDVPNLDVPFMGAPGLTATPGSGATVYHRDRFDEAEAVLAASARCAEVLDARFGAERPLPEPSYVLPPRAESGYARKTYVVLTDVRGRSEEDLTTFVCHELAHFWSSGAPPLTVENWLNEGLAVYVSSRIGAEFFGEDWYRGVVDGWREDAAGQGSIWTPEAQERRPHAVNYKKAPLALERLREMVGEAAMVRIVRRYMTDPVNSTPALLEVIEEEAGADAALRFREILAEGGTPAFDEGEDR